MDKEIIFKLTLINNKSYIVIDTSVDSAINNLTKYLDSQDLHFISERIVASVQVIGDKICKEGNSEIYNIVCMK